jgi:hypothetical protein
MNHYSGSKHHSGIYARAIFLAVMLAAAVCATESSEPKKQPEASAPSSEDLEQKWGIKITSLQLSANGFVVDFRYKVLDPEKAVSLGKRENKPLLIDQATGAKFRVPTTPKIGPLRQTAVRPTAGKIYFMLFATGKFVKPGNKVTVVIGDFRAENLIVEGPLEGKGMKEEGGEGTKVK